MYTKHSNSEMSSWTLPNYPCFAMIRLALGVMVLSAHCHLAADELSPVETTGIVHPAKGFGWSKLHPLPVVAGDPTLAAGIKTELLTVSRAVDHVVVRARLKNHGSTPVQVSSILWTGPDSNAFTMKFPGRPRYFSTENLRGDYFPGGTCYGDRYFNPLPNATTELGWSEDHVFPGVFIAGDDPAGGLLACAASKDRFQPLFRLRGRNLDDQWYFQIEEKPGGVESISLEPGAELLGEEIYLGWCDAPDPQLATDPYYQRLRVNGTFLRLADNPLPAQRIWCSWNYDFFESVTEADVMKQLPILREHFPSVKFVQIDDGYQRSIREGAREMIDLIYNDGESFDPVKFPSGAKGVADKIKAAGFRPAIWLGLWASLDSRMIRENPDWILLDDTGKPLVFKKWYGGTCLLDPSVPGVRDYLERLCRVVFREWGYEGVKLDFSSFAFEGKRVRFRYNDKTAAELERWLVDTFRRYLPTDGFFGWCVVCGSGTPFAGAADYFRVSEDIGKGEWPVVRRIAAWNANSNILLQQRPVLPNIDSVGVAKGLNAVQQQTWLNLCAITGAALEVSGDLTLHDAATLSRLNQTLQLSDPLRRVRCFDVPQGTVSHPPAIWLSEGVSGKMLALFNWSDVPVTTQVPTSIIPGDWRDAWTGKPVVLSSLLLSPHGSALFFAAKEK